MMCCGMPLFSAATDYRFYTASGATLLFTCFRYLQYSHVTSQTRINSPDKVTTTSITIYTALLVSSGTICSSMNADEPELGSMFYIEI
jgi:hypothetical protein